MNRIVVFVDGKTYAGLLTEVTLQEELPQEEPLTGDAPQDDITPSNEPIPKVYETAILYGVNFRTEPYANPETYVYRMLPRNEMVHVIEELDTGWLKIEVQDGTVGYISASIRYTNYGIKESQEKLADKAISFGSQFLGVPYVFGAMAGQTESFDCSSFVQHVWNEVLSINLPRVSYNQATKGAEVSKDDLRKGDLMFFSSPSRGLEIGHVGIYAGDNTILHTYSPASGGVRFDTFLGSQWDTRFVVGRRFI